MVAVAVAIAGWDVRASALVDFSRAVANATCVKFADAVVYVVANAVSVSVFCAVASADAHGVKLVAVAVAVTRWDVRTSTLVDLSWAVANATCVKFADAVVYIVADAVHVGVSNAIATTHAQGVFLVAVAVAVAGWDAITTAHTALVKHQARTVVGVRIHVVVAGHLVCATEHFILARTVVVLGRCVVVDGRVVGTTASVASTSASEGAGAIKFHAQLRLVCTHAEWEHLIVDLA